MHITLMNRPTQFVALLCILSATLVGCSSSPATLLPSDTGIRPSLTDTYWPTSTPEEQAMDSQRLEQMLTATQQQKLNLHSLLIIRNGYLIGETYFGAYQPDTRH